MWLSDGESVGLRKHGIGDWTVTGVGRAKELTRR